MADKVKVREIPTGSHINGRPVLDDGHRHLARYDVDRELWVTYCGVDVPEDHRCPPLGAHGPAQTCWPCDVVYRRTWGLDQAV